MNLLYMLSSDLLLRKWSFQLFTSLQQSFLVYLIMDSVKPNSIAD